jgi:hypothetical protein
MTEAVVYACRVEQHGQVWGLRNLHTGLLLPLEAGDLFYVAAPSMVPPDIDAASFAEELTW